MRHRYAAGLLGLVTIAAIGLGAPSSHAGPAGVAGVAGRTVTLVTGDQVTLLDSGQFTVEPGRGRERLPFLNHTVRGHLSVIPADAIPLLNSGRLDERLFDVTGLLDLNYDRRDDLPLIVTARLGALDRRRPAGLRVDRDLPAAGLVAGRADRAALDSLWRDTLAQAGSRVFLDGVRQVSLDVSVPHIGAPAAWAQGFDGTGVTVAVLDTGIDGSHPDLAGKVVAEQSFVEGEDTRDRVGHGTHVASTIAGTGAASAGRNRGVAPGATLLSAKVCAPGGCPESAILAGLQWAVVERGARLVNLSLGGPDTPAVDPIEQAVTALSEQYGALFIVAAGNTGGERTVSSPASADAALAVGAVDDHDVLAEFSSRGPRVGDSAVKPDLAAPGVNINAAFSADAGGTAEHPYLEESGTSMATPHVTGAAAILAQRHPDWTGDRLKATLMGAAVPSPDVFGQRQLRPYQLAP